MSINCEDGFTRRKQAFEEMVRSYARKKGYELHYNLNADDMSTIFIFINGTFKAVVSIWWLDPQELYDMYNKTVQYVEAQLEPSNHIKVDLPKRDSEKNNGVDISEYIGLPPRHGKTLAISSFLDKEFHIPPFKGPAFRIPRIKDVIFNDPATIVFWADGTKTVVKCQNGEEYDPEKGLAMAISKKALGNKRTYYHTFLKWLKKYEKKQQKEEVEAWVRSKLSSEEAAEGIQKLAKIARTILTPGDKNGD